MRHRPSAARFRSALRALLRRPASAQHAKGAVASRLRPRRDGVLVVGDERASQTTFARRPPGRPAAASPDSTNDATHRHDIGGREVPAGTELEHDRAHEAAATLTIEVKLVPALDDVRASGGASATACQRPAL